jgi:hypothetical protein
LAGAGRVIALLTSVARLARVKPIARAKLHYPSNTGRATLKRAARERRPEDQETARIRA